MSLDPWSYAEKTRKEHAEQVALFMWAAMAKNYGVLAANTTSSYSVAGYAEFHKVNPVVQLKWLHAIHNQGHGDKIRGGMAKAEGVKAGVFDIFLPVPKEAYGIEPCGYMQLDYCGLYIELKRKDGGKASTEQLDFQNDMHQAGYKAEICHGWEAARDCILEYLNAN